MYLWLPLLLSAVYASPSGMATRELTTRENENVHVTTGEPARDRIIFVVLALVCMMGMALMLGMHICPSFTRMLQLLTLNRRSSSPAATEHSNATECHFHTFPLHVLHLRNLHHCLGSSGGRSRADHVRPMQCRDHGVLGMLYRHQGHSVSRCIRRPQV